CDGGDALTLRLGLLELLRATGRLVAPRLPAVRRAVVEAARAHGRALRVGRLAFRGVRQAAPGVQGDDGRARVCALLALEAVDGDGHHRRGPVEARVALGRLAHAHLG